MARARNIKPGFFKNYELADAGPLSQLLFAGLWCLADKEGRLEDKPRKIKAEIFPYYDCDINGELTVLERLGFVKRYVSNGIAVIQVQNFKKHQSPHHTEKPSTLPAYDSVSSCSVRAPVINCEITVNSRNEDGGNPPDLLIPDSLIHTLPSGSVDTLVSTNMEIPTFTTAPTNNSPPPNGVGIRTRRVGKPKPLKTPLPEDFGISDRVRRWAEEKGHIRLEEHLEAFLSKVKANGYQKIDWDEFFMCAVRENWAKLGNNGNGGNGGKKPEIYQSPTRETMWWHSDDGIEKKAKELGLSRLTEESCSQLRARIFDRLKHPVEQHH
jgi:hypothetical protein